MKLPFVMRCMLAALALCATSAAAIAADTPSSQAQPRIDVPVKLTAAKVVYNISEPLMTGDMPVGLRHMRATADQFREDGTKWTMVGVFYGGAGYMLLNDAAYNRERKVTTGNPYKAIIAKLIADGVHIEECVGTMRGHGWTNADLLPDARVNGGATLRIIGLVQQGYVMMMP